MKVSAYDQTDDADFVEGFKRAIETAEPSGKKLVYQESGFLTELEAVDISASHTSADLWRDLVKKSIGGQVRIRVSSSGITGMDTAHPPYRTSKGVFVLHLWPLASSITSQEWHDIILALCNREYLEDLVAGGNTYPWLTQYFSHSDNQGLIKALAILCYGYLAVQAAQAHSYTAPEENGPENKGGMGQKTSEYVVAGKGTEDYKESKAFLRSRLWLERDRVKHTSWWAKPFIREESCFSYNGKDHDPITLSMAMESEWNGSRSNLPAWEDKQKLLKPLKALVETFEYPPLTPIEPSLVHPAYLSCLAYLKSSHSVTTEWQRDRTCFNHSWLKNRYLMALRAYLNALSGSSEDPVFDQVFIDKTLPEWEERRIEVSKLISSFEERMSPTTLFEHFPLSNCDKGTKEWLRPIIHDDWLKRYNIRNLLNEASAKVNAVDEQYKRIQRVLVKCPDTRSIDCLRKFASMLSEFHQACEDLSKAISKLPDEVKAI